MRSAPGSSLLFLVVVALVAAGCAAEPLPSQNPSLELLAGRGWHELEASPLSPRYRSHAFWTGEEVLILGGSDGRPCPPNADCAPPANPPLSDGAAYDPKAGSWRALAAAPIPLGTLSGAIVDGTLYVRVQGIKPAPGVPPSFFAYRIADDRWEQLAEPPDDATGSIRLLAAGDTVLGFRGSHENGIKRDLAYDRVTDAWRELPGDPITPAFDRQMVWTGQEVVLLGLELVPSPNSTRPSLYRAASLDLAAGAWRRLPESGVVGSNPSWHWSGGRIVNPSIGGADGGQVNNWGRTFPFGGMLTPPAGDWGPLPAVPQRQGPYRGLSLGGEEDVVSGDGWVLHVPSGTWTELVRPQGAADEGEAAVWAGDRLVVWGGVRWGQAEPTLLDGGWAWTPR